MKHYSFRNRLVHLYRNKTLSVSAALLVVVVVTVLQPSMIRAQRKKETGPRATAVVTWNGDEATPTPGTSVLTPVAIRIEGRYYDAELYHAQPEPLAVEAGVVYDVLKSGEVIGTFTVGAPRERDNTWYGTGAFEKKGAKEQAAKSTPSKTVTAEPEDERPKLRRGAPPPPAPKEQTDEVLNNIDRDPERPTLRRHTAEERKAQSSVPVKEFVPPEMHMMVAISDAGGPEPRPFTFRAKSGEVDQLRASMEKLSRAELEKKRKPAEAPKSKAVAGSKQRASVPTSAALELQNGKLGVFDVNSNNAPILVYSATALVDGVKKYITVAAWEEIDQSLRKVFTQITDDRHLDVYPRLEVIDALDTSGNGRGELLFRAFGDQGSRFLLYHPGPDSLSLLFDSARS